MAKITRLDANVLAFASQALASERTVFGAVTESDTLDANVTADFLRGWGIVGPNDEPTREDFNGLGFTLGQFIAYLHQVGVAEWNGNQEYHQNSFANRNGVIYICLTDNHTSITPPENDAVNWVNFGQSGQNIAVFDTAGVTSWDVPVPLQMGFWKAHVTVVGGGGGGAYRNPEGGSGGGAGGLGEGFVDMAGLESVTVTVGAGGAGGASSPSDGNPGGSSSFGSFISATGGEGGGSTLPLSFSPGGIATGGDVNNEGQAGSRSLTSGEGALIGGYGGGPGGGPAASSGVDASVSGSGGGGSTNSDAGNGADGIVIIRW